MEDTASNRSTIGNEPVDEFAERVNLDGTSIISTPDKLQFASMPSVDNVRMTTTALSVLSEKDEIDFLGSSAKTIHKTISDYVGQSYGAQSHLLAQGSYDRSPLLKYRNHREKVAKRQKPAKNTTGKNEKVTKQPTQPYPIEICRPGYKPQGKRKSRQVSSDDDDATTTQKPPVEPFKASQRTFEFKPSVLTLVDSGPVTVRKIQRSATKPVPFKGTIKETRSSKLRFEYNRKQGSIPSHLQEHMNKYKKPPFRKAISHPNACFEDIIERLQKIKKLVPTAQSPVKGVGPSGKPAKTAKSRKPKKTKKPAA